MLALFRLLSCAVKDKLLNVIDTEYRVPHGHYKSSMCLNFTHSNSRPLKMIGKGFYRKWVKKQFWTVYYNAKFANMRGKTNGWIILQNAEILKFYCSTIPGNLRNLWRHLQWLNYSKGGGGMLHFVPSFPFPSLPQSSPPFPPSIPLEVGRPLSKVLGKCCNLPQRGLGGAPAEIVFGAFKA